MVDVYITNSSDTVLKLVQFVGRMASYIQ